MRDVLNRCEPCRWTGKLCDGSCDAPGAAERVEAVNMSRQPVEKDAENRHDLLTDEDWQAIADDPRNPLFIIPGRFKELVEERIRLRLAAGVALPHAGSAAPLSADELLRAAEWHSHAANWVNDYDTASDRALANRFRALAADGVDVPGEGQQP